MVRRIWQVFFCVWLDLSRDFLGYFKTISRFLVVPGLRSSCQISCNPFWKFLRLGNLAWDFLGVNFWSRDFFGFCRKPWGFFWVLIFGPIRSSPSLETFEYPPGRLPSPSFCQKCQQTKARDVAETAIIQLLLQVKPCKLYAFTKHDLGVTVCGQ